MIGSHTLIVALLVALLPAAPARSGALVLPDGGGPVADDEHVSVTLVADTAGVAPGQRFRLGVLLRIDPTWHVYWVNAGEGGFPTSARLTAPAGFEVAEPRFPAPHRFTMPGDIVAYGFEEELLLIADVTAPAELEPGAKLAFGVEASWLECADVCIPGSAGARLELAAVASADAARKENAPHFARWTARLPRPLSELEGARASWSGTEDAPRLRIETPGVEPLELFPYENQLSVLEEQRAEGGALVAGYRFRTGELAGSRAASGVLRVRAKDGTEAFYELDLPWTSTREAGSGR
jgi:DsbC/DsbD-like thiol-disulfide interchange protein